MASHTPIHHQRGPRYQFQADTRSTWSRRTAVHYHTGPRYYAYCCFLGIPNDSNTAAMSFPWFCTSTLVST